MFVFKPLAAIQFWLVQLLIPETQVMAFELLYLAKYFQNFSYFISKVSKNWWLSHYNWGRAYLVEDLEINFLAHRAHWTVLDLTPVIVWLFSTHIAWSASLALEPKVDIWMISLYKGI